MTDTRTTILRQLLEHKPRGSTVGELSSALGITRSAVKQQIVGLERDGLVAAVDQRITGGRPSRSYGLTEKGAEEFPRGYAKLAQELIVTLSQELGEQQLERLLSAMAARIAAEEEPRLAGAGPEGDGRNRLPAVVQLMNELGYEAQIATEGDGIAAANCIYHAVASRSRAVCRFDVELVSLLLGRDVTHANCMLDGHSRCRFQLGRNEAVA